MYRTINKYCLPMMANCTPYIESDFDACVKEFCAQKRGPLTQPKTTTTTTTTTSTSKNTTTTITTTNDLVKQHRQPDKLQAKLTNFEAPKQTPDTMEKVNIQSSHHSHYVHMPGDSINQINTFAMQQSQLQQPKHHYSNLIKVPHSCKVIVTGDVAVGKTSLINRFGYDVYSSHYKTTIGVDFDVQKFQILGIPYVLQIWDTAGLERFKCITSSYYRGCQAAIIVFDMSNLETLKNAIKWRDEILESCQTHEQLLMGTTPPSSPIDGKPENGKDNNQAVHSLTEKHKVYLRHQQQALIHHNSLPIIFLVGSKSDLISDINLEFVSHQAKIIANRMQAELWTVSAQTGDNVTELFTRIATVSFNKAVLREILLAKYEASTLGVCLKQKIIQQQQKDSWNQGKLIKISRKKKSDDKRAKCINIQCVIK